MKRPLRPLWATLAGVVVGVAISVTLVATGVLRVPEARDTSDASPDFLAAWERSLRGTYAVESDFRRTMADGRTLYSATEEVRLPPDAIVRQFGGIDGSVNGHPVVCSTDPTGVYRCTTGQATAPPFEDRVRTEMDRLRSYVTPPVPGTLALYRVVHGVDPGCFELFEQLPYADPVYGHYAKFCFDEPTGALAVFERHLDDHVIESREAIVIRADVSPLDLSLEQNPEFDVRMDLGASPSTTTTTADSSGTTPELSPAELHALSTDGLVGQGSSRVSSDENDSAFTTEAVERIETGRLSINDPVWRRVDGTPVALARPVVLELLRRGYAAAPER